MSVCMCHWHCNKESSARRSGVEGYFTVVVAHYRLANGKAHSSALAWFLGREKRVKDAGFVLRRDASASVFKNNGQARCMIGVVGFRCHAKRSAADRHGVERIYLQIHEDLLQLVPITFRYQRPIT